MPVISYFNLNQTYLLNSAFFMIIIFVGIFWMHNKLHAKIMTETNNVCNDPVAQFFNRKAGEKCILDKTRKDTTWVENKYDKNMAAMNDKADEENRRILKLTEKYNIRNGNSDIDVANNLYLKNKAVVDLETTVSNIKTLYSENETGILSLYNDYSSALQDSIVYIKNLADKISAKLSSNVYVKKYQKKRDIYSKSYKNLGKQMKILANTGIIEPGSEFLPPLTYLQRYGKR